jgi:hypothetical protein
MNLLQIVREHARRQGLPLPTSVASSLDGYAQQARGLLNEFCDDLNTRKVWQTNIRQTQWTSVAAESQGTLDSLAPYCYEGIVPQTTYEHSQQRMMEVVSPQEWQARKVCDFVGPYSAYRLMGGEFLVNPVPALGETYSFEYYSSAFVYFPGVTGGASQPPAYRRYWENDLDTSTVGADLAIAYLRWAWKREKGFDYSEDFLKYERMLLTKSSRNDSPQPVRMDAAYPRASHPGIVVPQASWNLP